jgi:RHS repeat-associated protein
MPLAVVSDVNTGSPNLYFVHADQIDTPIMMTDDTKAVVWNALFLPFGSVESITGSATNNMRFPGQYFLIEDGLHYNWYRHYDPTLGRYTRPDPLIDVLATYPNTLGKTSQANFDAAQLPGAVDLAPEVEIASTAPPGFTNGPSNYAYVKSAPTMRTDPTGLLTGPFTPIPRMAQQCVSLDCTKVIANCKEECIGVYVESPNSLPGSGHDMFGRMRRCIRECARRSGCDF